jgi:hypothetical protein
MTGNELKLFLLLERYYHTIKSLRGEYQKNNPSVMEVDRLLARREANEAEIDQVIANGINSKGQTI